MKEEREEGKEREGKQKEIVREKEQEKSEEPLNEETVPESTEEGKAAEIRIIDIRKHDQDLSDSLVQTILTSILSHHQPVPTIGDLIKLAERRWVCLKCGNQNNISVPSCPCGYRELYLSRHFLHSPFLAACTDLTQKMYWTCEKCKFKFTIRSKNVCQRCGVLDENMDRILREENAKKVIKREKNRGCKCALY